MVDKFMENYKGSLNDISVNDLISFEKNLENQGYANNDISIYHKPIPMYLFQVADSTKTAATDINFCKEQLSCANLFIIFLCVFVWFFKAYSKIPWLYEYSLYFPLLKFSGMINISVNN